MSTPTESSATGSSPKRARTDSDTAAPPSGDAPTSAEHIESTVTRVFPRIVPMEHDFADDTYYVRECFPGYYRAILELLGQKAGVSLTGSPGTGKSVFMAYFFERYSRERPDATVLMVSYSGLNSVVRKAVVAVGGREVARAYDAATMHQMMRQHVEPRPRDKTLFLLDGVPPAIPADARWMAFSSPREAWRKTLFENASVCTEVVFPSWTVEEMVGAAHALARSDLLKPVSVTEQMALGVDADAVDDWSDVDHEVAQSVVDARFQVFGSVPRWCLSRSQDDVRAAYARLRAEWDALTPTVVGGIMKTGMVPDHALNVLHYWQPASNFPGRVLPASRMLEDELIKRVGFK